ncbi:uncharacterized protein LOC34620721 [Cyclospora cayetanensis]|uniref:Uncharacterized protein LOC34620721 n=1 Tax=Cyclospora cayetanensis TaxID=88456 RepID=A0A6P6RR16_9EIME|nr:uncharacterized protein LOC34620721 [Cyclospora cayetanensis]
MPQWGLLASGSVGGFSLPSQQRLAFTQYFLHQIRNSRDAYYPEGCGGGKLLSFLGDGAFRSSTGSEVESAAALVAAGAEGLAGTLDPSVPISTMLDALALAQPPEENATAVVAAGCGGASTALKGCPSWGSLAKAAACGGPRPPNDALELYLCELLLPLLDDAIAALCSFMGKLQADEQQYVQHQKLPQMQKQPSRQSDAHQQPETSDPYLLLDQGIRSRFDPLVWLGQFLLRQGKAAEAYTYAAEQHAVGARAATTPAAAAVSRGLLRGEHLQLGSLPTYSLLRKAVKEERAWRAFEALKPQVELLVQRARHQFLQQHHQSQQQETDFSSTEQEQEQQKQHLLMQQAVPLTAEVLPSVLQAVDAAWELPKNQGFYAAVLAEAESGKPCSMLNSCRSSKNEMGLFPSQLYGNSSNFIMGACSGVYLEAADPSDIQFSEFWRFLGSCLDACPPLKYHIFSFALRAVASSPFPVETDQLQQQN